MNTSVMLLAALLGIGVGPGWADMPLAQGHDRLLRGVEIPVSLDGTQRVLDLAATLQIADILAVMRQEGLDYGKTLEADIFPGKGGARWVAAIEGIYDEAAMRSVFEAAFVAELGSVDPATLEGMAAFFGSDRGQRILTLEVQARRALLDQETEDAAKAKYEELAAADDPRLALIRQFTEANDLIEMNVAGTLNANLAFYKGMAAIGEPGAELTEDQMLQTVWSQEPAIRDETVSWLYPYLTLAYGPLPDEDLEAYLAFSDRTEGRVLNAALFAAFNVLFTELSSSLGRAAAKQLHGEDI